MKPSDMTETEWILMDPDLKVREAERCADILRLPPERRTKLLDRVRRAAEASLQSYVQEKAAGTLFGPSDD
jgi:hypothetical protein